MYLKEKTAIITGGAMGIGFETAKLLASEGCTVTIWDINETELNNSKSKLLQISSRVYAHVCDVTDKERVDTLVEMAIREMGRIDILVNNAGFVKGGGFLDAPAEDWDKTVKVNLNSILYTIRAVLPKMYERNFGYIINISSASSFLGVGELSVYAATKWAVQGLTESLRFEAWNRKKYGVKFCSVHPYYIATGMFSGAKLNSLGSLLVSLVKSHSVIARAIVYGAIKKNKTIVRRPVTLKLVNIFRGILPDYIFQKMMVLFGVSTSMKKWVGRK
jgi:all-trans-retinol dehydrogenase (NAD+)